MKEKTRVYQLAREMLTDSKVILRVLNQLGVEAKNHMSTMEDDVAAKVRDILTGKLKLTREQPASPPAAKDPVAKAEAGRRPEPGPARPAVDRDDQRAPRPSGYDHRRPSPPGPPRAGADPRHTGRPPLGGTRRWEGAPGGQARTEPSRPYPERRPYAGTPPATRPSGARPDLPRPGAGDQTGVRPPDYRRPYPSTGMLPAGRPGAGRPPALPPASPHRETPRTPFVPPQREAAPPAGTAPAGARSATPLASPPDLRPAGTGPRPLPGPPSPYGRVGPRPDARPGGIRPEGARPAPVPQRSRPAPGPRGDTPGTAPATGSRPAARPDPARTGDARRGRGPIEPRRQRDWGGDRDERSGRPGRRGTGPHAQRRRPLTAVSPAARPRAPRVVTLEGPLPVKDLASKMAMLATDLMRRLIAMGIMASINQDLEADTAALVASELGFEVVQKAPELSLEEKFEQEFEEPDDPSLARTRPPVVTVMGHVDHGKTSLLDAIRHTNVTAREAGGITQHIGASVVEHKGKRIVFLDTPGHEAFTTMRARGAKVTDIAVLVVAADDGVMPQTIEALNHARAAGVPVVVAINKVDRPNARPDRVRQQLTEHSLVAEEWGGETIFVPVSATARTGIDQLLEMILLVAEVGDLKADPSRKARGTVIEAQLDKGRGPVATVLIHTGTLKVGDAFVTGTTSGRVRDMTDAWGRRVKRAGPSMPVEVGGMAEVPQAGDNFLVIEAGRLAKDIAENRQVEKRQRELATTRRLTLDDLFTRVKEGDVSELNLVIKADVQGSVEAVRQALEKLGQGEVRPHMIHSGVGAITESDIMLAAASNAIVIGFNVRPDANARRVAEEEKVDVRTYRIIYEAIHDIEAALKGLLKPKWKEVIAGRAEVRTIFRIPKVGVIAGCYVTEGKIDRSNSIRLIRNGVVVNEGKLSSLRRFKDDVREVSSGFECGIGIEKFQDIKEGDILEAFTIEEVKTA